MHRGTCILIAIAAPLAIGIVAAAGCAGANSTFGLFGTPFTVFTGNPDAGGTGVGNTGTMTGGGLGGAGSRAFVDPCTLPQARKFVRISMRNDSDEFVHYFLLLVAFVATDTQQGGVCEDDIPLYTAFGYEEIEEGASRPFGNICIDGPALFYFHRGGQFRTAGGVGLASAIGPAQGTSPTFDAFFTSSGAQVPIPDRIYFHNPGTGEGAALKISDSSANPCSVVIEVRDPDCEQDAFYYVDETDRLTGSTALGNGSGRRVPNEIQDTGCACRGIADAPFHRLGPAGATAANATCDEFLRGGSITYVFTRNDTDPPIPQLVWRVVDGNGAIVRDFDSRTGVR